MYGLLTLKKTLHQRKFLCNIGHNTQAIRCCQSMEESRYGEREICKNAQHHAH